MIIPNFYHKSISEEIKKPHIIFKAKRGSICDISKKIKQPKNHESMGELKTKENFISRIKS